jgi:hypothetical protein
VQYNRVITCDVVSFDLHKTAAYLYIEQLLLYNVLRTYGVQKSFRNSFKKKNTDRGCCDEKRLAVCTFSFEFGNINGLLTCTDVP